MTKTIKSWFLLQFKPNAHQLAEQNLRRQGFDTFLPLQEITQRKTSRFRSGLKPLFPGYMFVAFEEQYAPWNKISNTTGVSKLVSFDKYPKPVPLYIVSELMMHCDPSGKFQPTKQFGKGDEVQLLSGPFANFIAKIEKTDSKKRVWVLMELMGQLTQVSVNPEQLRVTK